ncbi:MAG: ABC transporter permease subunit [Candidatus Thermoplasmatota archaeon]
MNLKKYIAWRTVHTIITMLIVIVLLFVLFRLMPGGAASRYVLQPGMTESAKDLALVKYGFKKWVSMPGSYYEAKQTIIEPGVYIFEVTANDSAGSTNSLSIPVNVAAPASEDYAPPIITMFQLDPQAPSAGDTVLFNVSVEDASSLRVAAILHRPSGTDTYTLHHEGEGIYSAEVSVPENGTYTAAIEVTDAYGNWATAMLGFATNGTTPPPSIYSLQGSPAVATAGEEVTISVIWSGTGLPNATLTAPNGEIQTGAMQIAPGGYSVDLTPSIAGYNTLNVSAGTTFTTMRLTVNPAPGAPPEPLDDHDASPMFTDFVIERDYKGPISYPHELFEGRVTLRANVTITTPEGRSLSQARLRVTAPDESVSVENMYHPRIAVDTALWEQFAVYMYGMLTLDFGRSFETNQPVWERILERIPATLWLFGNALIVSTILGIAIGVLVAWRRGTAFEMGTIVVTLFFWSMPVFWFGLLAQWIFYFQLNWLPLAGMTGATPTGEPYQGLAYVGDLLWHLILPLMTLSILHLAGTILVMRTSMLEVMGEDYITTARAKGLRERTVVFRHAARNALLPVVTNLAMSISGVISGGVLTETIFSWPGMGTLLVYGVLQHDYPVVQGAFAILAFLTILGNAIADILYAWLDPRVQL